MRHQKRLFAVATTVATAVALPASGQCLHEDFDGFAIGTIISTQLDGVTISATPGTCGGFGSVRPIVVAPPGGTSSGSRALGIENGCPEFNDDWLVLDFDRPQRWVTFTIGEQFGTPGVTFHVRSYNSGGGLLSSQNLVVGSSTRTFVSVGSPTDAPIIASIEIEEAVGLWESIDDLRWGWDPTAPTARIDSPSYRSCQCTFVSIVGEACDDDGEYGNDIAEYRPVNGDPEDWTTIGQFTAPLCGSGTLYNWDLTDVPHGSYYVRLTVTNACGISNTDVTVVRVDKLPPTASISRPADGATICGSVEIFGNTNDTCPDGWDLGVAPEGGAYTELASGGGEAHCVIHEWDTTTVPDGEYTLRLRAYDVCGRETEDIIMVTVNNADGCECGPDTNGDGVVDILDLLAVLGAWTP